MMLDKGDIKETSDKGYAIFDKNKEFRYSLVRNLENGSLDIGFIMLNPSTADHIENDNTITRCISFAKSLNAKKLYVFNLFAFRSTNPKNLKSTKNPIGKNNDNYIKQAIQKMDKIIIAWGGNGNLNNRSRYVLTLLQGYEDKIFALRVLKNKEPGHPLYISKSTKPFLYFKVF